MRSRFWVMLDTSMLIAFVALQSWRLTGVVVHEWLSVALIAGLLAHLVLHWSWVATRSKRVLAPRSTRTRVNYALNLTLFIAATVAMVSGLHDLQDGALATLWGGIFSGGGQPAAPSEHLHA